MNFNVHSDSTLIWYSIQVTAADISKDLDRHRSPFDQICIIISQTMPFEHETPIQPTHICYCQSTIFIEVMPTFFSSISTFIHNLIRNIQ